MQIPIKAHRVASTATIVIHHLQHQDVAVEEAVEEEVEALVTRIEDLVEEEDEDLTATTEVVVVVAVPTTATSKWIISERCPKLSTMASFRPTNKIPMMRHHFITCIMATDQ